MTYNTEAVERLIAERDALASDLRACRLDNLNNSNGRLEALAENERLRADLQEARDQAQVPAGTAPNYFRAERDALRAELAALRFNHDRYREGAGAAEQVADGMPMSAASGWSQWDARVEALVKAALVVIQQSTAKLSTPFANALDALEEASKPFEPK